MLFLLINDELFARGSIKDGFKCTYILLYSHGK